MIAHPASSPNSPARWLDDEEQATWRAFLAATQLLMDRLDRELQAGIGIPHAYYEILVRLSEAPGRTMRMSDLAGRCHSSRSRLSHAVSRLEEQGWVRREAVESDRRGAVAILTDAGLAALEAAAPIHVEGVRRHLFDQLDGDQLQALGEISRVLAEHLEATSPAR
ncbi:MAG TPA: MarR family transcriptional regulator [Acidimicrobiia bacterium]|nr:MarR family transcriptional regulator [Acidimicrobiia bacterium]